MTINSEFTVIFLTVVSYKKSPEFYSPSKYFIWQKPWISWSNTVREDPKSYLDEEMEKSPPSNSLILQKSIPFTNGTAVSSSRVKCI